MRCIFVELIVGNRSLDLFFSLSCRNYRRIAWCAGEHFFSWYELAPLRVVASAWPCFGIASKEAVFPTASLPIISVRERPDLSRGGGVQGRCGARPRNVSSPLRVYTLVHRFGK